MSAEIGFRKLRKGHGSVLTKCEPVAQCAFHGLLSTVHRVAAYWQAGMAALMFRLSAQTSFAGNQSYMTIGSLYIHSDAFV